MICLNSECPVDATVCPFPSCSCAIACFAQFYPKLLQHFPKLHLNNTWLVAGCVVAYAILSSLMTGGCRWQSRAVVSSAAISGLLVF